MKPSETTTTAVKHHGLFDNLITIDELITYLRGEFAKGTIYNWIHGKHFPHIKVRGRLYFSVADVDQWLMGS